MNCLRSWHLAGGECYCLVCDKSSTYRLFPDHLCGSLFSRICFYSENQKDRPTFSDIVEVLDKLLSREKGSGGIRKTSRVLSGLIDRHSTWF